MKKNMRIVFQVSGTNGYLGAIILLGAITGCFIVTQSYFLSRIMAPLLPFLMTLVGIDGGRGNQKTLADATPDECALPRCHAGTPLNSVKSGNGYDQDACDSGIYIIEMKEVHTACGRR